MSRELEPLNMTTNTPQLSNAFRDAVAELLEQEAWLKIVNHLHQKIDREKDGLLSLKDLNDVLVLMFQVNENK